MMREKYMKSIKFGQYLHCHIYFLMDILENSENPSSRLLRHEMLQYILLSWPLFLIHVKTKLGLVGTNLNQIISQRIKIKHNIAIKPEHSFGHKILHHPWDRLTYIYIKWETDVKIIAVYSIWFIMNSEKNQ